MSNKIITGSSRITFCETHGKYSTLRYCVNHNEHHRICDWTANCKTIVEKANELYEENKLQ
mgnify:CR=1 FL=1